MSNALALGSALYGLLCYRYFYGRWPVRVIDAAERVIREWEDPYTRTRNAVRQAEEQAAEQAAEMTWLDDERYELLKRSTIRQGGFSRTHKAVEDLIKPILINQTRLSRDIIRKSGYHNQ